MDISFDILGLNSAQAIFDQSELLLRIAIACVLGILIGNERKNRNKSAGVRTHAIVAMGSALMMVVSKYGFVDIMDYGKFDGARIAAQVVSGVGFLGAGIIFVRNNLVSGLTTSAGIWATAGVGLAMGAGLYVIGIASALMIILMQGITHKIAHFADVASGGTIWMTIAQEDGDDFVIGEAEDAENFFDAAGIESPGLTSAPAIGVYVAELVAKKAGAAKKADWNGKRKGFVRPGNMSKEERAALIKERPEYGSIVCRCEGVSEGEIMDAINRTLGAVSLDGIKRRVRQGMGRCQAGFCTPRTMEILARERGMKMEDICKNAPGSNMLTGSKDK